MSSDSNEDGMAPAIAQQTERWNRRDRDKPLHIQSSDLPTLFGGKDYPFY